MAKYSVRLYYWDQGANDPINQQLGIFEAGSDTAAKDAAAAAYPLEESECLKNGYSVDWARLWIRGCLIATIQE